MSASDIVALGSLAVSIVAVLIAGVSLRVSLRDRRPRVEISIHLDPYRAGHVLVWEAHNIGSKPMRFAKNGLILPGNRSLDGYPWRAGHHIPARGEEVGPERKAWSFEFPSALTRDLVDLGYSGVVPLVAYFEDETRRVYRSEPFRFDIEAWRGVMDPPSDRRLPII